VALPEPGTLRAVHAEGRALALSVKRTGMAAGTAAACELASTPARVNVAVQMEVSAMGRRKPGAGGGHAAVLSAGAGWEARRAAGLGVRPETAAEATGRPPGKSLGASCRRPIHWRL